MEIHQTTTVARQLLLTPEAQCFLEGELSERVQELAEDICRALDGRQKNDGITRLSAPEWLVLILDPIQEGGPERVIVWRGPTDGPFFQEEIVERAFCLGMSFL